MLGLPPETAPAFVVGFLRRDFGAAGLFDMARHGRIDPVQSLVAMVTITLFIPCIANFFMIVKERGWKTGRGDRRLRLSVRDRGGSRVERSCCARARLPLR